MENSILHTLKKQLLTVVLDKDPEASIELFAIAAMHGDLDTLDFIIERLGNRLGNLEEMMLVRNSLADIIKRVDAEEERLRQVEAAAADETNNLLKKFQL